MLRKANKLGIIDVHNTKKHGWKGHNVYVFNPYKSTRVDDSITNDVQLSSSSSNEALRNYETGQAKELLDTLLNKQEVKVDD